MAKYVLRKVKNVGKPYAGKPHVRFDEKGLEPQPFTLQPPPPRSKWERSTNQAQIKHKSSSYIEALLRLR